MKIDGFPLEMIYEMIYTRRIFHIYLSLLEGLQTIATVELPTQKYFITDYSGFYLSICCSMFCGSC